MSGEPRVASFPGPLVVALAALLLAAAPPVPADSPGTPFARAVDRIVERPALAHAFWGIEVRSLETGRIVYERHADKALRPASTLKLVTTAAALDAFGPEARVRTTVETTARLDDRGRLLGDVFLVGRGDSSLSDRFDEDAGPAAALESLADALAAAGVGRIEGRLVGQEGAFGGDRRGTDWMVEDLPWGYGAEVSALSFHDNAVRLTLAPGERPGDPAVLTIVPETSFVAVESSVVTGPLGTEEEIVLDRPVGSNRVLLSGVLPPGREWEEEVAVEDPASFAATVFAEELKARGITVAQGVATSSEPLPPNARVLAAHEGASLARRIREVNQESLNLHAELLLRLLGRNASGEGTTASGLAAVRDFLDRLDIPRSGWRLRDGSGLSHTNLVTPRGLATLLRAMDRHPHGEVFRASLSIAGTSGKLEDRLRGTPAEGRVAAKTGALRGVTTLAGYVTRPGGERLAFVILVNNHTPPTTTVKGAIDEIVIALTTAR